MHNIDPFSYCSRCGKEFTDLKIEVSLGIQTWRLKQTGIWEGIANLDQRSTELLCPDCFDMFADVLSQMNVPYTEKPKDTIVEPVDNTAGAQISVEQDVQYKH